jgi:hypothetical protein
MAAPSGLPAIIDFAFFNCLFPESKGKLHRDKSVHFKPQGRLGKIAMEARHTSWLD